ncbi:MAG: MFS transporter [Bacillota bacterium]
MLTSAQAFDPTERSPHHRRTLLLLSLATLGSISTWFSMTAVLPEITRLWQLSDTQASLITVAVQAGFVAGSLCVAFLNLPDRIAPPTLFAGAALLAGSFTMATPLLANSLWEALILRFLTGCSLAGVYGPGVKLMATWFRTRRGMALGVMIAALTVGSAFPHLIRAVGAPSWRYMMLVTGGLALLSGLLVRTSVGAGPYPLTPAQFSLTAIPNLFRDRAYRLINFGYWGHMWELYAMWAWFGAFGAASLAALGVESPGLASLLTFGVIAVGGVGAWGGGLLADRFGRERLTIWSMLLSGACCLLIGFTFGAPPWLTALLAVVWGIGIIADSAQFSALVTERAAPEYVGTAVTLQLAVGFAITMLSIRVVPWVVSLVGWTYAFWILAPGPLLGSLAMHLLRSRSAARQKV